jgi:hypothetical protein
VIEPGEGHADAAAIAIVLDQEQLTDPVHAHLATGIALGREGKPAVVQEGDAVPVRHDLRLDGAGMDILGTLERSDPLDPQPAADAAGLDLDPGMRLVPVAEPVGQSGGSHRRHWYERRAPHPAVGPGGLVWRLIGDAGKGAARLPNKHGVAGHEVGFLAAGRGRSRAAVGLEIIVIGALDEVDTRLRRHSRDRQGLRLVPIDAEAIGGIVRVVCRGRCRKQERAQA